MEGKLPHFHLLEWHMPADLASPIFQTDGDPPDTAGGWKGLAPVHKMSKPGSEREQSDSAQGSYLHISKWEEVPGNILIA